MGSTRPAAPQSPWPPIAHVAADEQRVPSAASELRASAIRWLYRSALLFAVLAIFNLLMAVAFGRPTLISFIVVLGPLTRAVIDYQRSRKAVRPG